MSEFGPKTFRVHELDVLSEVVTVHNLSDGARAFHVKSSCRNSSQTNVMTVYMNPSHSQEQLEVELEKFRLNMAEELAKAELGIAPPKAKYLGVRIARPDGDSWSSWMLSIVDLRSSVTRVMRDVVEGLGLPLSSEKATVLGPHGEAAQVPLYQAKFQIEGKELKATVLAVDMGLPCVVGADLLESAVESIDTLYDLFADEISRALRNAAKSKKRTVLIIGPYGEEIDQLKQVQSILRALGYRGILLQDFPDIEEQSLPEKMMLYGSISRFVICLDIKPSGHNTELETCVRAGFVTAVLRPGGKPSTWMQADIVRNHHFIEAFPYTEGTLLDSVKPAVQWAEKKVQELAANYDSTYPWRNRNVRLA